MKAADERAVLPGRASVSYITDIADLRNYRIYDFREGMSQWGHSLHASTWREIEPRTETTGHLWWRKTTPVATRASVMVHCSPSPQEGDRLLMTGHKGDWNLAIVGVDHCWNPRDMFTLTVEFPTRGADIGVTHG